MNQSSQFMWGLGSKFLGFRVAGLGQFGFFMLFGYRHHVESFKPTHPSFPVEIVIIFHFSGVAKQTPRTVKERCPERQGTRGTRKEMENMKRN